MCHEDREISRLVSGHMMKPLEERNPLAPFNVITSPKEKENSDLKPVITSVPDMWQTMHWYRPCCFDEESVHCHAQEMTTINKSCVGCSVNCKHHMFCDL